MLKKVSFVTLTLDEVVTATHYFSFRDNFIYKSTLNSCENTLTVGQKPYQWPRLQFWKINEISETNLPETV